MAEESVESPWNRAFKSTSPKELEKLAQLTQVAVAVVLEAKEIVNMVDILILVEAAVLVS